MGIVREVAMPPSARALSTVSRVDYEDCFLVDVRSAPLRTGEQWARAVLEEAPTGLRRALRRGWFALGLQLGSTHSDRFVLGWELRRSTSDHALLAADGRFGLSAELLFAPRSDALLFGTFVRQENRLAQAVWPRIAPGHRRVVHHLLARAGSA